MINPCIAIALGEPAAADSRIVPGAHIRGTRARAACFRSEQTPNLMLSYSANGSGSGSRPPGWVAGLNALAKRSSLHQGRTLRRRP
jgi:hypothetical protein